ncbi:MULTISPECIES: hypothetical protein [Dietzia]|uniref:hypothetical protein n=1 Tax=Dietzia TaxID=37914 RepID=UPI001C1E8521|nr:MULTISPECIES: hypothetical protein [Dietzia]MCT1516843.1 hypothetical protein [Dietzia cercidiphylli]
MPGPTRGRRVARNRPGHLELGGPPLRIWVNLPRWGDGSTGESPIREATNDVIV